jgi:hypothetical protein
MVKFEHVQISHVPQSGNASADALAKLVTSLALPNGEAEVKVEERWLLLAVLDLIPENGDVNIVTTNNVHDQDWHKPFIDYFKHGTLPSDPVKRR